MTWVAALATSALFPLFLARGAGTAAVLFAPVMLGAQTTVVNQFGMDGSAVWSNAVTALTVKDARAELRGRLLAVAVLTVPWTALVAVAAAVVHGGFGRLPAVLGLTYALLGALLAVGLYVSVRWPYSVKDTRMGAQPAPGQQGAAWLSSFVGLLVCTALIMPVVLVHGLAGNVATAVVGPLYGLALAAGLVHHGGRLLYDRFPELLLDVAKS
jgi:ABC-2 type transport system permease protein